MANDEAQKVEEIRGLNVMDALQFVSYLVDKSYADDADDMMREAERKVKGGR